MKIQDKAWLWASAIVLIAMGLLLVQNNRNTGWFLVILGITYTAISLGAVQKLADSNLHHSHWGLFGVTALTILLVIGVVAVIVL